MAPGLGRDADGGTASRPKDGADDHAPSGGRRLSSCGPRDQGYAQGFHIAAKAGYIFDGNEPDEPKVRARGCAGLGTRAPGGYDR